MGESGGCGGSLSACEHKKRNSCGEQDTSNSNPNPTQYLHPNQGCIETKVPVLQAEHVVDDGAPVTAEYVPAKASDEEYG
jgi:hypothetical protein